MSRPRAEDVKFSISPYLQIDILCICHFFQCPNLKIKSLHYSSSRNNIQIVLEKHRDTYKITFPIQLKIFSLNMEKCSCSTVLKFTLLHIFLLFNLSVLEHEVFKCVQIPLDPNRECDQKILYISILFVSILTYWFLDRNFNWRWPRSALCGAHYVQRLWSACQESGNLAIQHFSLRIGVVSLSHYYRQADNGGSPGFEGKVKPFPEVTFLFIFLLL